MRLKSPSRQEYWSPGLGSRSRFGKSCKCTLPGLQFKHILLPVKNVFRCQCLPRASGCGNPEDNASKFLRSSPASRLVGILSVCIVEYAGALLVSPTSSTIAKPQETVLPISQFTGHCTMAALMTCFLDISLFKSAYRKKVHGKSHHPAKWLHSSCTDSFRRIVYFSGHWYADAVLQ